MKQSKNDNWLERKPKYHVENIAYCIAMIILFPLFQAVQDVQGPEVYLHADGGQPGGRAVDHPQGQR